MAREPGLAFFRPTHDPRAMRARLPPVAAGWTSLFVLCSLGTFLLGRGSDAQAEACAGTSYRDSGECDDRSDAAPVVSYSGILFPERAVFLFFGVPCAPLWFLTILLSHRALVGLVDAACVTRARVARGAAGASSHARRGGGDRRGRRREWIRERSRRRGLRRLRVASAPDGAPRGRRDAPASSRGVRLAGGPATRPGDPRERRLLLLPARRVQRVPQPARRAHRRFNCRKRRRPNGDASNPRRASSDSLPARAWTPSAFFLNAQRFKANVLLALFGAMVPVAAFWATMTYAWGGEEHMAENDPRLQSSDRGETLGNGACVGCTGHSSGEMRRASRGRRAQRAAGRGDPDAESCRTWPMAGSAPKRTRLQYSSRSVRSETRR